MRQRHGGPMIEGNEVRLRPVADDDWPTIEGWAARREGLWGPFQRHQLDHLPTLHEAYERGALLSRESMLLLIERKADGASVGFVRHAMSRFPDHDCPYPDVGFVVADPSSRGRGYATESLRLLVEYLFAGLPTPRIAASTDVDNLPARRVLERSGFREEGRLRSATFRDGAWHDVALYGLLRAEWPSTEDGVG